MRRIKLIISYDGTAYCGWQVQPNGLTVQEVLNRACTDLFGEEILTIGASRTDAGVHAHGQVAVVDTNARMPGDRVAYALNTRLPDDIRIQGSTEVPETFHPRFAQTIKTYEYCIYNRTFPDPINSRYCTHIYGSLDIKAMKKACAYLLGEHDFACFQASGSSDNVKSTVRTIYSAEILTDEYIENSTGVGMIRLRITGNGFLYHMVRIIAGSLIEIGQGKHRPEWLQEVIDSKRREMAGQTAPAKGLTLEKIVYPEWDFS